MILRQHQHSKRVAFTLMEIIVVVAIILILASAGVFVFTGVLAETDVKRATMDVRNIEAAVETYNVRYRYYPESLYVLTERDEKGNYAALLVESALKDPWGQDYIYERDTVHSKTLKPRIYSTGPPGANQTIANWTE